MSEMNDTEHQIIAPRWLVSVNRNGDVYEGYAVVLERERIKALGPVAEIRAEYGTENWVSLERHALLPGLINTHTHAAMSLLRGYADDLQLMEWLQHHIWPAETKWVNRDFVAAGTRLAAAEMLLSGTTCFNDMYFFPDVIADCATELGIRACVGLIVLDFPTVWAADADEYLARGLEVRDNTRHNPLVTTALAPHAPYTVSDESLTRVATLAEELDIRVHTHVHETAQEVDESVARYQMRPLERLDRLGLLTPRLLAVHMTQLLDAEIETAANRGIQVIHCAESNLKLASGHCPVRQLKQHGVNVALGTDGASSNNDLDMLGEMRTASLLAKGISGDPTALSAHQALAAATIDGARALGLDDDIGSIETGKQADLMAIDLLSHPATQPVYQPVSQIVYSANRNQVSDVWVAGRQRVREGQLVDIDLVAMLNEAGQWQQKISTWRAQEART